MLHKRKYKHTCRSRQAGRQAGRDMNFTHAKGPLPFQYQWNTSRSQTEQMAVHIRDERRARWRTILTSFVDWEIGILCICVPKWECLWRNMSREKNKACWRRSHCWGKCSKSLACNVVIQRAIAHFKYMYKLKVLSWHWIWHFTGNVPISASYSICFNFDLELCFKKRYFYLNTSSISKSCLECSSRRRV